MKKFETRETEIYIGRMRHDVQIPQYESESSAGMDIRALGRWILFPQQKTLISTGLVMARENPASFDIVSLEKGSQVLELRPRSSIGCLARTHLLDEEAVRVLRIANEPGTIDNDYRGELKIGLENTSLPTYETWQDESYKKLWHWLEDNGIKNGDISDEQLALITGTFGELVDISEKKNRPGILLIESGTRIAQGLMHDASRVKWNTEKFLTTEERMELLKTSTPEEVFAREEQIRETHLAKVKSMGTDRGGGFGSTGTK